MSDKSPEVSQLMDSVIEITGQLYDMGIAHGRKWESESYAEMLREASSDVNEAEKRYTLKAKECTEWCNKAARFELELEDQKQLVRDLCESFPVALGDELYRGIYDRHGKLRLTRRYRVVGYHLSRTNVCKIAIRQGILTFKIDSKSINVDYFKSNQCVPNYDERR